MKKLLTTVAFTLTAVFTLGVSSANAQTPPWPTTPPAEICGNTTILNGPPSAPSGAVTVPDGDNSSFDFDETNTVFWFEPGTHTLANDQYGQIQTRNGNTYIGAPGAILDGQNVNKYAFTGDTEDVTIKYLTIKNFGSGMDNNNEGVVNHDSGTGWVMQYNTVIDNDGAGVFVGSDNVVSYNCLKDNGQYGFSMFKPPLSSSASAITNIVLDHNEITGNNQDDWESEIEGCGCTGGGKFWDVKGATVTNNWVHNNLSVGLWADTNNIDFLFEGNYIDHNSDEGIWYEISYNATIRNNTFKRNAWVKGDHNHGSPASAVYISESGGDSRLSSSVSGAPKIHIYDNYFEDNFSGVSIFENANRFCNSNGNTSKGYCTPFVAPKLIPEPHDFDYVDPINASHPCYTDIDTEPYTTDCRWHSKNVEVNNNEFHFDEESVPTCGGTFCGAQALIATGADNLSWSPYTVAGVQTDVMFNNNNLFHDNEYHGNWTFAKGYGDIIDFATWQDSPYNQDEDSTIEGQSPTPTPSVTSTPTATPTPGGGSGLTPNHLNANTATLEGGVGNWSAWYSSSVSQTTEEAHSGTHSLKVNVTDGGGWGVELSNWPGFDATPGDKVLTWWAKAGSGTITPTMTVKWLNSSNAVLQTDTVPMSSSLTSTWQKSTSYVTAPTGTATVLVTLTGGGSTSDYFYADDFVVGDVMNTVSSDTSTLEGSIGDWEAWYSSSVARSSDSAHTGTYSLKTTVTDPYGWGVQVGNWPGFETAAGVKRISYWAKKGAGTIEDVTLRVRWFDGEDELLQTDEVTLSDLDSTWKNGVADVIAPTGAAKAFLELTGETGTTDDVLYVDDVSITNIANLLDAETSSLESGLGHWQTWYSSTVATSTSDAYYGTHSLLVTVTDPYGWGVELDNWPGVAMTPGEKRVTFSAKKGTGDVSDMTLRVRWFDDEDELLDTEEVPLSGLTSAWQRGSAVFTAPAGTAKAFLDLTGETGDADDTAYVDGVIIADEEN